MKVEDTYNKVVEGLNIFDRDLLCRFDQILNERWLSRGLNTLRKAQTIILGLAAQNPLLGTQDEFSEILAFHPKYLELKSALELGSIKIASLESKVSDQEKAILIHISEKSALQQKLDEAIFKLGAPKPDSSNSGMPPSGDLFRPSKGKPEDPNDKLLNKKLPGPKVGHKPHFYSNLDPTDPYIKVIELNDVPKVCPCCGAVGQMSPHSEQTRDFVDLERYPDKIQIVKIIYKSVIYKCGKCGKVHYKPFPGVPLPRYLFGPGLLAHIVNDIVTNNMTTRLIQEDLKHEFGITTSLGHINKCIWRVVKVLLPGYFQIMDNVKLAQVVNADETVFRERGKRYYTWVFVTKDLVFFTVGDRSTKNLDDILTSSFSGVLSSDMFNAYDKFLKENKCGARAQKCVYHLIRELKHCFDHHDSELHAFGEKGLEKIGSIMELWLEYKEISDKETVEAKALHGKLVACSQSFIEFMENAPKKGKAKNLAKRFDEQGEAYFTFLHVDGVEPTNNAAETSLRPLVIMRKIRLAAQGLRGRLNWMVLISIKATCKKQGINFEEFISQSINANERGELPPSPFLTGEVVSQEYIDRANERLETLEKEIAEEKKEFQKLRAMAQAKKDSDEAAVSGSENFEKNPVSQPEDSGQPPNPQSEDSGQPPESQPEDSGQPPDQQPENSGQPPDQQPKKRKKPTKLRPKKSNTLATVADDSPKGAFSKLGIHIFTSRNTRNKLKIKHNYKSNPSPTREKSPPILP
jgi:transposase